MSDTPETDKELMYVANFSSEPLPDYVPAVDYDFARRLELERNAALAECALLRQQLEIANRKLLDVYCY